ncbi:MAG TPA: hypothetical protein EYP80_02575 [Candidatus Aenigmarchaeota archaeon]|nr:hypothetical protein [Candidatus Aenigmarchaeota archaeon]
MIIIGDKASEIELQAVNEIANYLENETGNKPLVKKYSEITEEDRKTGKGKGILEILRNPYSGEKYRFKLEYCYNLTGKDDWSMREEITLREIIKEKKFEAVYSNEFTIK